MYRDLSLEKNTYIHSCLTLVLHHNDDEIFLPSTVWMNLEIIMLSKISQ